MRPITTIIGEVHNESKEKLSALIANNKNFNVIGDFRDGPKFLEAVRTHRPELVILSKDLKSSKEKDMDALMYCRAIVSEFPFTTVIIVSLFEEPKDLREAMKAGARDFVALEDFDERLVSSAIELVTTNRKYEFAISDKNGFVVSLISSKGGTGKTTIAINMAAELANRLKNKGDNGKVLLLDYDLQFGDVSYLGNLKPNRTIADLNDMKDIDQDALEAHLVEHELGFWVLAAPKKPQYADIIDPALLQKTITISKRLFDYIIIDSMQGFHKSTMAAVDASDIICIVSSSQLVHLKNTKLTIETLEELFDDNEAKQKIKLIVNKYDRNSIPVEEVSKRFKYELLGYIPKNDAIVSQATNYNKIIVSDFPTSDVAKSIKSLVDNILNNKESDGKEALKSDKQSGSLFSRLFSK